MPAEVRPRPEGGYEIISGVRCKHASELANLESMPAIIRDLDNDDAIIRMVDSNIQRENTLLSERVRAFKMRTEAAKRKAGRPRKGEKENSPKISANYWNVKKLKRKLAFMEILLAAASLCFCSPIASAEC